MVVVFFAKKQKEILHELSVIYIAIFTVCLWSAGVTQGGNSNEFADHCQFHFCQKNDTKHY